VDSKYILDRDNARPCDMCLAYNVGTQLDSLQMGEG